MIQWNRIIALAAIGLAQLHAEVRAQAPSGDAPTEIITGQGQREVTAKRPSRRSEPYGTEYSSAATGRSDHTTFLNPLPPLPKGPFYGKIKRPRKHRLDQDRDGYVSKQELDLENQTRSVAFQAADQNRDGKLDGTELRHYQALVQPRGRSRH